MLRWLRAAGKVRADRAPDWEIAAELFRTAAPQWKCPHCGQAGLVAAPAAEDDADWPEARRCAVCGKPIPAERLEALPHARQCAACQRAEESGQAPVEPDYCPRCGNPMELRLAKSAGISRYAMVCRQCTARR